MTKTIAKEYRRLRNAGMGGIVGMDAASCLASAKTIAKWNRLADKGLVRLRAESDSDVDWSFLDTWEHLSDRSKKEYIERYSDSACIVIGEYKCPHCWEWKWSDSVSGCLGYKNPIDPSQNPYVVDLMEMTMDSIA